MIKLPHRRVFHLTWMLMVLSYYGYSQQDISGTWNTGESNTKVQISNGGDSWSGKVISSDNPKAKPGMLILKDLKKSDQKWLGKIFAPKKGEWFDVEIVPEKSQLNLKVMKGFLSKTVAWKAG